MKMYKYINEKKIERAPKSIKEGNLIISNPKEDKLRKLGYMELVAEDYPETDEGFYRECSYHVEGDKIIQSWSEPIKHEEVPECEE